MALKFILSICVLMHLKGHVAGSSVDVEDCMVVVGQFPEELTKGFAEVNATKESLDLAIESISPIWNYGDYDGNMTEQDPADVKAEVTSRLTACFNIRKVN